VIEYWKRFDLRLGRFALTPGFVHAFGVKNPAALLCTVTNPLPMGREKSFCLPLTAQFVGRKLPAKTHIP